MIIHHGSGIQVYLALGATDMRKAIDGLSILVNQQLKLDPFSGNLFVFCNRSKSILKILYWDRNGFCLWQKRLERHFFRWPVSRDEVLLLHERELTWLLDGLDPLAIQGHSQLIFSNLT
jgi:transposase